MPAYYYYYYYYYYNVRPYLEATWRGVCVKSTKALRGEGEYCGERESEIGERGK